MKKVLMIICVFSLLSLSLPIISAKSYGWGFKPNDDHRTPEIGVYAREIEGTSSYYVGDTNEKAVYLTFDSGYDNGNLAVILDVLSQKKVRAAFFVTGDFVTRESALLQRMAADGHIVGNHTWSHKHITALSFRELQDEIGKVEDAYTRITNREMMKFFRPPAGEFNREALLNIQKLGYSTIFWSLAYKDWDTRNQRGRDYAYSNVIDNLHNGAIILMHSVSRDNTEALPLIIDEIRNRGYRIQTIEKLAANIFVGSHFCIYSSVTMNSPNPLENPMERQ